jgi:hypothetical protein
MQPLKKTAGKRKPALRPDEAEMAVYSLLFTSKPTPEESRLAVRLLLRRASADLQCRGGRALERKR